MQSKLPRRSLLLALPASSFVGCVAGSFRASVAKDRLSRPAPNVEKLVALMSLDEKLGQMTQADVNALRTRESDVADLALGSVLNGGDSLPPTNLPRAWADQYDRLQAQALNSRLGIPLIVGTDAVHGHALVKGAVMRATSATRKALPLAPRPML